MNIYQRLAITFVLIVAIVGTFISGLLFGSMACCPLFSAEDQP